jgi:hypothetical protein
MRGHRAIWAGAPMCLVRRVAAGDRRATKDFVTTDSTRSPLADWISLSGLPLTTSSSRAAFMRPLI